MILLNLIVIMLVGGALAWWSERFGHGVPRLVALFVVLADLLLLQHPLCLARCVLPRLLVRPRQGWSRWFCDLRLLALAGRVLRRRQQVVAGRC